jgi:hypothetical protein
MPRNVGIMTRRTVLQIDRALTTPANDYIAADTSGHQRRVRLRADAWLASDSQKL